MPTTKQLFNQWEINHEFNLQAGFDKGSEHPESKSICAQSVLDKRFEKNLKRSPFDQGDKGLKR